MLIKNIDFDKKNVEALLVSSQKKKTKMKLEPILTMAQVSQNTTRGGMWGLDGLAVPLHKSWE